MCCRLLRAARMDNRQGSMKGWVRMKGRFLRGVAAGCFLVSLCSAFPADAEELYDKIWSVAVQIAKGYAPKTATRVAVVNFVTLEGDESRLGELIAEKMTTYLQRAEHYVLIERRHLKHILDENNIARSKLFDSETANRLGRLMGAQAVLTGTVTDVGSVIDVNARLIDCEKGLILSTASAVIAKDQSMAGIISTSLQPPEQMLPEGDYKTVVKDLAVLTEPVTGDFAVDIWTDRMQYAVGEEITFYCRASRDCYVTLIDIGPTGTITILFPNRYVQVNKIEANKTYTIPAAHYGFSFVAQPPGGLERVKAVASLTPIDVDDYQFKRYAFRSISPQDRAGTRDIGVYLKKLGEQTQWTENSLSILIK